MRCFTAFVAVPLVCWAGVGWAAATDARASDLTATLQTCRDSRDGVVNVPVESEAYGLTLNLAALIADIPDTDLAVSIGPAVWWQSEKSSGARIVTQDQAFDMIVALPGQLDKTIRRGNWAGISTFDTAQRAFATASRDITECAVKQAGTAPNLAESLGAVITFPQGVVAITPVYGGAMGALDAPGFDGRTCAGRAATSAGTANVAFKRMAKIRAIFAAGPEETAMQVAPALAMAEGRAKPGADGALIWALDMMPAGGVFVNGVDAMTKGIQGCL